MVWTAESRDAPALKHWHPVAFSHELTREPKAVRVHGYELVVFRTPQGVAALEDRCSHRGARLSAGKVKDGCVECPYHLWTFGKDGQGKSPVNPRMKPFVPAFEVTEHHGAIWVRRPGSDTQLPLFQPEGLTYVGVEHGQIDANYKLVVDNFTEIEHSPTNHFVFAFDREGIKAVEPKIERTPTGLHVNYQGPQRPTPWWTMASVLGLREGLHHVIDFQVGFSPLTWCYDMYWEDPETRQRMPQRIREYAVITPMDDGHTDVFLWFYSSMPIVAQRTPIRPLARKIFMALAHHEFMLDKRICENVATCDPRTDFKGKQLGKFDRVLTQTRPIIRELYDPGTGPEVAPVVEAPVAEAPVVAGPPSALLQ